MVLQNDRESQDRNHPGRNRQSLPGVAKEELKNRRPATCKSNPDVHRHKTEALQLKLYHSQGSQRMEAQHVKS